MLLVGNAMEGDVWSPGPSEPRLAPDELHIWRAPLVLDGGAAARMVPFLSQAEKARASRFLTETKRRNFALARGLLRDVLARYLDRAPAGLEFDVGPHGKPFLSGQTLAFNLSHCTDFLLIAVTAEHPVGIDVERVRSVGNVQRAARHCLSPNEAQEVLNLPSPARSLAILTAWTRKEAYLKAIGAGLAHGLRSIEVSVVPGSAPVLKRGKPTCSFFEVAPGPNHCAAVAVLGSVARIRRFSCDIRNDADRHQAIGDKGSFRRACQIA